jgi:hypothetical protein
MTQVILQPAGRHYADSIQPPVPMDRLARFLDAADLARLRDIYAGRPVPTWGVTPGDRGANLRKWERITPGDVVLMARAGHLIASGTVTHTTHNRPLATELWGSDEDGETWEYLYFLDDVRDQAIPYAELNRAAGYAPGAVVQGFNVLSEAKSAAILGALPLAAPALDARSHLAGLVGRTIQTLSGAPNTVLGLQGDDVIVATRRSPQGQPVPIAWVQAALDRLRRDGEVEISVASVGYRSAFVGAVLAALPGARTAQDPPRVLLSLALGDEAGTPAEGISQDVDAVEEAVRPRTRRQRWAQSPNVRRAVERHAMRAATEHYRAQGWTVEDVSAFCPYDLHCDQGGRVLCVEVKGTASTGERVVLTRNEVAHARAMHPDTALFVLADVTVVKEDGDTPSARGGREVIVQPWIPRDEHLEPIAFEYSIPP